MKELIVDFRKQQREHVPIHINGTAAEKVKSFKFLGVHITDNLKWSTHTDPCPLSTAWPCTGGVNFESFFKFVSQISPMQQAKSPPGMATALPSTAVRWWCGLPNTSPEALPALKDINQIKSNQIVLITLHMVSRCYCESSEMLVLLVPTVHQYLTNNLTIPQQLPNAHTSK